LKTETDKETIGGFKGSKIMVKDPLNKADYKARKILKKFKRLSLILV
jgi:hypothetical protein